MPSFRQGIPGEVMTQTVAVFRSAFMLLFLLIPVLPAGAASAEPWGPWSVSTDAPVMLSSADRVPPDRTGREEPASVAATPFLWLLGFYQNVIGPVTGGRCPMYPTCSQYSVQAIRKHGPAIGIVMTADRLMHELDEQKVSPLVRVGTRYRVEDTVEENDFWWYGE